MSDSVTICFEASSALQDSLDREAAAQSIKVDVLINDAITHYLASDQNKNSRAHGRVGVEMSAVARPIDGEVGTAILPGKILDLSEGGLKLQCHCDISDIEEMVQVGGQVEIIFTVPDMEYPVCFTCEVRHIFQKDNSELGCEFLDSSSDNQEALKSILNTSLN